MQKSIRYIMTVLVLGSFLLSACAGAAPQGDDSGDGPQANSNEVIDADGNVNDNNSDANENASDAQENENDNGNDNDNNNGDDNASGDDLEFSGIVDAITDTSIIIDGVEYSLADFTEIKGLVSVGDQVKIHVIVNADGTFTIREIELSSGDDGNSNGNSNSNNNGDDSNDNSNDDDDDNSNDSNSNDNDDDKDDDKGKDGNDNDDD